MVWCHENVCSSAGINYETHVPALRLVVVSQTAAASAQVSKMSECVVPRAHLSQAETTSESRTVSVSFTVIGACSSLKNSKQLSTRGGKIRTIKNPAVLKFQHDFMLQIPPQYRNLRLGGPDRLLKAVVTVYYPTWRNDLDCAAIYDCLQAGGVVSNDRWIREKHEYAEVDSANPRVEVDLELM